MNAFLARGIFNTNWNERTKMQFENVWLLRLRNQHKNNWFLSMEMCIFIIYSV